MLGDVRAAKLPHTLRRWPVYRMRVHCEMNHNLAFAATRLRNTALLFERGECDRDFAELGIDITDKRESVAERIRQLADAIEDGQ